ncbi:MAG: spore germination protein [Clostridia bacterium]|nr:spore germination protein [Clostridia bacterium]
MKNYNIFKQFYNKFIKYTPTQGNNFFLTTENIKDIEKEPVSPSKELEPIKISNKINYNLDYLKSKYNSLINSDIVIRNFNLIAYNKEYSASLIFIDGMVETQIVNNAILKPLMLRNDSNTYNSLNTTVSNSKKIIAEYNNNDVIIRKIKKVDLKKFIYNNLIPQNSVKIIDNFESAISSINMGNTILIVDTVNVAFDIDAKGFKQRSISSPKNEIVVRGSQEAFVENLRTNTSMLRRIINNENLVIENCSVGKISKTKVAICYLKDIANNDLVAEVKFRVNNLDIDYLTSSGQLEQLIQDSDSSLYPQLIATERPDKVSIHLLEGRVAIIVNDTPYVLVAPGVLSDFMSSPEDTNYKFQFSNMLKFIRLIASFFALFLPGIYVAVTSYHHELLPTELLFTIEAARETVPFPVIFEILLMEISFELIREAGVRVPSPIGPTIGIVGGLILGEAAVSANLVSQILIIIVAITAICSFSIPDFSLNFTIRIARFIYILLGYMAGFLGIAVGMFIQLLLLCSLKSFGCPYITPFVVNNNKRSLTSYFLPPIWKRENRSNTVSPKKKYSQGKISMIWKSN